MRAGTVTAIGKVADRPLSQRWSRHIYDDTAAYRATTAWAIGGPAAAANPSAMPIVGADRFATAAMRFCTGGYGTISSALIALPTRNEPDRRPVFRFAGWQPESTPCQTIPIEAV